MFADYSDTRAEIKIRLRDSRAIYNNENIFSFLLSLKIFVSFGKKSHSFLIGQIVSNFFNFYKKKKNFINQK